MAFQTGSASSFADLLSQLSTFITANGWTEDERDNTNGDFAFSKNSIFVSGRWQVGTEGVFSLHQATAFDGAATLPGDHTGDSGNGFNATSSHVGTTLDNERSVDLESNGPYPNYWFFENDASPAYVHVVVEFVTNRFAHFGFGEIVKTGDGWTGGEYCYGHIQDGTSELGTSSTCLLDGYFQSTSGDDERQAATIRMSGLPNQAAGAIWGNVWGRSTNNPTDDAGNPKDPVQGGFRSGLIATYLGIYNGSDSTGLIPGYPIALQYRDVGANAAYWLGFLGDVRGVVIHNFSPRDRREIGTDSWYIFPTRLRDTASVTGATGFQGIMYRRVDA